MVEHSDGLNALCVRPVVCQLGVVTAVVAPLCFVLLFIRAASVSIGSIGSFGPSLGLPFGSCRPQTLLWPLLTPQRLSAPGSPRLRVRSFRSRLWALHSAFSGSWASCLLAHSPQTLCLIAHLCSFGRTFAFHPFAPLPYGIDLAVRLRLAPQAPDGNLSSRQIGLLPGTRARLSSAAAPAYAQQLSKFVNLSSHLRPLRLRTAALRRRALTGNKEQAFDNTVPASEKNHLSPLP